MVIKQGISVLR